MTNQLTIKNFFFCYDVKLSKFIKENNIPYFMKARSMKDNKIFTMYEQTEQLQTILTGWKK
ncbi:hypothetical protein [Viridibacillus arvi]|uniref:hypothetical protein n=1 Tax=Viridibacillus arvi TaxID=263475 RepID=UPI003D2C2C08